MRIKITLFFLSLVPVIYAQDTPKKDVEVITFGNNNPTANEEYKSIILKVSPTAFIFGNFPMEIEKELNDFLSVQAGVGLTFKSLSNFIEGLNGEFDEADYCNSTRWADDYCDNPYDFTIREGKLGFTSSISARLYWDEDGFEGWYISPLLRYSTKKYSVQKIDETQSGEIRLENEFDKETIKNIDLVVQSGLQRIGSVLTWEFFTGVGVRIRNASIQDLGWDENFVIRNGISTFKSEFLRIEFGFRVGFRA